MVLASSETAKKVNW